MELAKSIPLALLLLVVGGQQIASATPGDDEESQCFAVPSNLTFCYGMLHSDTKLPNLLGDKTIHEMLESSRSFHTLFQYSNLCHSHAQQFVCSLVTPICLSPGSAGAGLAPGAPLEVPPCRGFCNEVRDACEPMLSYTGDEWPIDFRCSRFPRSGICLYPNITNSTVVRNRGNSRCEHCSKKVYAKSLLKHYCVSSLVLVGNVDSKHGTVLPRGNLGRAVYRGLDLAQRSAIRIGSKTHLNVTNACTCNKNNRSKNEQSGYLIFADHTEQELVANLVVSLNELTMEQIREWRIIKRSAISPLPCVSDENSRYYHK